MSLIRKALRSHWRVLNRVASETIRYRRGTGSLEMSAIVGQSEHETVSMSGSFSSPSRMVDFLIAPDSLGTDRWGHMDPEAPTAGDQIIRMFDNSVYDVAPGMSETVWEWSDSQHTFIRVHTIRRGQCE